MTWNIGKGYVLELSMRTEFWLTSPSPFFFESLGTAAKSRNGECKNNNIRVNRSVSACGLCCLGSRTSS